jgi:hypothetical protein
MENRSMMVTRKCGPSGGIGGKEFADDILPQDYQVVEVYIYAQEQVYGVQIIHETCEGRRHPFLVHGRTGGELHVLRLDADEFIVSISGQFSTQVDSLRIQTNKKISSLFGGNGGAGAYVYEAPSGTEIVGFYGRAGDTLDAIGVVLRRRGL